MKSNRFLTTILALTLISPVFSWAATGTVSGQMMFMLKTAGQPLVVSQTSVGPLYQNFQESLLGSLNDGSKALALIRGFEDQMKQTDLEYMIESAVAQIADPKNQRGEMHFFEFIDLKGNEWMLPMVQYAAGDESDEEPIYVTVNRELRDGQPDSEKTTAWTNSMRESMWHLPRFEGMSFRGTRLTEERIEKYYPLDKRATDAAFISTSLEPSTALKFANPSVDGEKANGKISVVFVILGKSGRPVSFFAHMHEHEQEILFANGTPFVTTAKSPIFDDATLGRTMIVIQQEP